MGLRARMITVVLLATLPALAALLHYTGVTPQPALEAARQSDRLVLQAAASVAAAVLLVIGAAWARAEFLVLRRLRPMMSTVRAGAGAEVAGGDRDARPDVDTVQHVASIAMDVSARVRAEEARHESQERLRLALAASRMGVWEWDARTDAVFCSPECAAILGTEHPGGARQSLIDAVHPQDVGRVIAWIESALASHEAYAVELRIVRPGGEVRWISTFGRARYGEDGRPLRLVGTVQDITERMQIEERLRQSQKMEAVGQLAGGVAHDFNNLLTVIIMSIEMLMSGLPADDARRKSVTTVRQAAERAAVLTRQLLAFSRKQILEPRVLDLNEVVGNVERMLRRLIGEDIVLTTVLSPHVSRVKVDPGQMEQVVINLAVNARDAMPQGGHLTLETRAVELDEDYCRLHPDSRPGRYTLLSVTDTGAGMPPDVKPRIFEPFFTTKGPGKGTGLGLATVFGIVKQSDGHIDFDSTVGVGTCFRIYLPAVEASAVAPSSEGGGRPARTGSETILLVEDEDGVRNVARQAIEAKGYHVLMASGGQEALAVAERCGVRIHLLVTDVVMPQMSGRELAERLRERHPVLKVLFMSGYTDDVVVRHGVTDSSVAFLQKPFAPATLAQKIQDVLEATP